MPPARPDWKGMPRRVSSRATVCDVSASWYESSGIWWSWWRRSMARAETASSWANKGLSGGDMNTSECTLSGGAEKINRGMKRGGGNKGGVSGGTRGWGEGGTKGWGEGGMRGWGEGGMRRWGEGGTRGG